MDEEYPINFNYVKLKKVSLTEDDGTVKDYHILFLDPEENKVYWDEYRLLFTAINQFDPALLSHWLITYSFFDKHLSQMLATEQDKIYLFGLVVDFSEDEQPSCKLVFRDGREYVVYQASE